MSMRRGDDRACTAGHLVAACLLALAARAQAMPEHAAGSAVIGARAMTVRDAPADSLRQLGTLGLELRAAFGPGEAPLGLAAGAGYQLGASLPGGFAYQLHLLPAGVAGFIDGVGWLALLGGGDVDGVTSRVPFAPRAVVEARLELDVPGPFRLAGYGRPAWLAVDARQGGARHFDFADEVEFGVGLRIGAERRRHRADISRGLFIGGAYREWLGAVGYAVVLGYAVDAQLERR